MTPASEQASSTEIMPILKRKIASAAASDSTSEGTSTDFSTGTSSDAPSQTTGTSSANSTCSANHTARFRITPTTAAVMAPSAALNALLDRSASTKGAPKKIQRKQGTKVTQVVKSPPSVAASSGGRPPGARQAPRNPPTCVPMTSGPGVVSAMPSPSSISPAVTQW